MTAATITAKPLRIQRHMEVRAARGHLAPVRLTRRCDTLEAVYVGTGSNAGPVFLPGRWFVRVNGRPVPTLFPNLHSDAFMVRDPADAVALHREWLEGQPEMLEMIRRNLAGYNLSCDCPEGQPCHADTLLELANN